MGLQKQERVVEVEVCAALKTVLDAGQVDTDSQEVVHSAMDNVGMDQGEDTFDRTL